MKPFPVQNVENSGLTVTLNGEPRALPAGSTVASLVRDLGLRADRVAVEMNRTIVSREAWESTQIPAAANLELVQFVGGG